LLAQNGVLLPALDDKGFIQPGFEAVGHFPINMLPQRNTSGHDLVKKRGLLFRFERLGLVGLAFGGDLVEADGDVRVEVGENALVEEFAYLRCVGFGAGALKRNITRWMGKLLGR
jgi:hypothetical protein